MYTWMNKFLVLLYLCWQSYGFTIREENLVEKCIATSKNNDFMGYSATTYNGKASYCSFLGIKYATAERYKEAVPYVSSQKQVNAIKEGDVCVQISGNTTIGSEDCLYLSVHTPNINGHLPVLVYIHGGGFSEGSAKLEEQDPQFFMETQRVVMVFIQYRLGALGFVDFNSEVFPSNLGMKDQVEALKWVKENIAAFGGNPEQVTLQGESAGAASVSLHLFSPLSKGLFQGGISESGTACASWSVLPKEWARQRLRLLAHFVGCPVDDIPNDLLQPADITAHCFKTKTPQQLVEATKPFALPGNAMNSFLPVIEKECFRNTFLTSIPWANPQSQVPWISGVNSYEAGSIIYKIGELQVGGRQVELKVNLPQSLYYSYTTLHPNEITIEIQEHYNFKTPISTDHLKEATKAITDGFFAYPNYLCHSIHDKTPSYNYYFNYAPSAVQNRTIKGVFHAEELQFLFVKHNYNIRVSGSKQDAEVSEKLVNLWVTFAEKGTPSEQSIHWEEYSPSNNQVLIIDKTGFKMGQDPNLRDSMFWKYLPFRELML